MFTESSQANVLVEETFPMLLIGRDHRISYANARAHRLFGYEHGGLHGLSIEQLLVPSRRAEVRNVRAVLIGQAARRWKSVMREAEGGAIEVNVGVEPCLDHRGQVIAVKLQCEPILPSRPAMSGEDFESGSGTRRLVPRPVPVAAIKTSRSSVRPPPPPVSSVRPPPPPVSSVRPPPPPVSSVRPPAVSVRAAAVKAVRPMPTISRSAAPKSRIESARPVVVAATQSLRAPPRELVFGEDGAEQLETALQLLGWLRQRVDQAGDSLDDPRERARMRYVLTEATELVAQVRCDARRK